LSDLPEREKFLAVWMCCSECLLGSILDGLGGGREALLTAAGVAAGAAAVPFLVTLVAVANDTADAADPKASRSLLRLRPEQHVHDNLY